jgi:hypothetical protein
MRLAAQLLPDLLQLVQFVGQGLGGLALLGDLLLLSVSLLRGLAGWRFYNKSV